MRTAWLGVPGEGGGGGRAGGGGRVPAGGAGPVSPVRQGCQRPRPPICMRMGAYPGRCLASSIHPQEWGKTRRLQCNNSPSESGIKAQCERGRPPPPPPPPSSRGRGDAAAERPLRTSRHCGSVAFAARRVAESGAGAASGRGSVCTGSWVVRFFYYYFTFGNRSPQRCAERDKGRAPRRPRWPPFSGGCRRGRGVAPASGSPFGGGGGELALCSVLPGGPQQMLACYFPSFPKLFSAGSVRFPHQAMEGEVTESNSKQKITLSESGRSRTGC